MKKITPEVIAKIMELQIYSNTDIQTKLLEQGLKIGLNTISKYVTPRRLIKTNCKYCGKEFTSKQKGGMCEECLSKKPYYTINVAYKEEFKQINNELLKTSELTGLGQTEVLKLLKENTHTEIRTAYKDGKQVKKIPVYKLVKC